MLTKALCIVYELPAFQSTKAIFIRNSISFQVQFDYQLKNRSPSAKPPAAPLCSPWFYSCPLKDLYCFPFILTEGKAFRVNHWQKNIAQLFYTITIWKRAPVYAMFPSCSSFFLCFIYTFQYFKAQVQRMKGSLFRDEIRRLAVPQNVILNDRYPGLGQRERVWRRATGL